MGSFRQKQIINSTGTWNYKFISLAVPEVVDWCILGLCKQAILPYFTVFGKWDPKQKFRKLGGSNNNKQDMHKLMYPIPMQRACKDLRPDFVIHI